MKLLTIDFTEGVTLQPFNIMTQAIESQKQMIMWFAENLGVLNEKRCNDVDKKNVVLPVVGFDPTSSG